VKPKLTPPGTERLKLKYDEPPSNFAFIFNLRHYAVAPEHMNTKALEQARREYVADKRVAMERRRQRMMAEEGVLALGAS
jgi:hypothetical protein